MTDPGPALPYTCPPASPHPPGALLAPAGAGSACAPAHPAAGPSTIQSGVHNLIMCWVKKHFPPSAQCSYPVISLGALCSIPQLSPVPGRSCQAFAVPKCLAELQVGSLSPGTSASPQLSTSAHSWEGKPGRNPASFFPFPWGEQEFFPEEFGGRSFPPAI